MPEHYITAGGKRLRCGRTTGTCAAMAAQVPVVRPQRRRFPPAVM